MATNNITSPYQQYPMNPTMSAYSAPSYQTAPSMQTTYSPTNYIQPTYQTSVPMPQNLQQNPQPQQVASDRIWVQGETSAKSYMVAKNTEQVLWDSEAPVIYIKTIDATGRPTTVTLDYTIRPEPVQSDGVANSEVSDLKKELAELKEAIKSLSVQQRPYKPNYKNNQKEVATND